MKTEQQIQIIDILNDCDMDCEGSNYHDRVGMAPRIYEGIEQFIPEKNRLEVAKIIAESLKP
jgi:hypothetical protein